MIKRSELARQLVSVTKPVMWPLILSTLCRIVDQVMGIVLLSLCLLYTSPSPRD